MDPFGVEGFGPCDILTVLLLHHNFVLLTVFFPTSPCSSQGKEAQFASVSAKTSPASVLLDAWTEQSLSQAKVKMLETESQKHSSL